MFAPTGEPRWRGALAVSVAMHVGVAGLLFIGLKHAAPSSSPAPAAAAIQIMPVPAAPPQPPSQMPVGPQQRQSPPRSLPRPADKIPPAPRSADKADVALSPTKPPPVKEQTQDKPLADKTSAPTAPPLPPNVVAAAQVTGLSPATADRAEQTWEGLVLAKLERKKRYPWDAQRAGLQDTIYVHVTVDRSGNVLNTRIERSKHFATLDDAALDLVRRSSPLPQPPASVPGDTVDFVVPVDFFIKRAGR